MKISESDFLLLTGLAEFHFKFAEYVREADNDLFYRAIDYAKTYTQVDGMKFDYWHEDPKKFLKEMNEVFVKIQQKFDRLVSKVGDSEEAKKIWMKKKKTSNDDVLGMKNYLDNFKHHSKSLNFDHFDMADWENFVNICKHIDNDAKFIEFAVGQIKRVLGSDSDLVKGLSNG
jgi:hypothetical protein